MPTSADPPAPLEGTRSGRRTRRRAESRLVTAACSGTSSERNAIISSRKPSRMTVPITRSSRAEISVGEVDVRRRVAADVRRDAAALVRVGQHVVAHVADAGRRCRRTAGAVVGTAESSTTSPCLLICGGVSDDDAGRAPRGAFWRFDDARVGAARRRRRPAVSMSVSSLLELLGLLLLLLRPAVCCGLELVGLLLQRRRLLPAAGRPAAAATSACSLELVALRAGARRPAAPAELFCRCELRRPAAASAAACCCELRRPAAWSLLGLLGEPPRLLGERASCAADLGLPRAHVGQPGAAAGPTRSGSSAGRARSGAPGPARARRAARARGRAAGSSPARASRLALAAVARSRLQPGLLGLEPAPAAPAAPPPCALEVGLLAPGAGRPARSSGRLLLSSWRLLVLERGCSCSSSCCCCSSCFCCCRQRASASAPGRLCSDVRLVVLLGVLLARRGHRVEVRGDLQRAVVADAEAGGDQVVGLPLGGLRGRGADVLLAELEREDRDDQRHQERQRHRPRPRPGAAYGRRPAAHSAGRGLAPRAQEGRQRQPGDPVPEQAEEGGQQRDRRRARR